MNGVGRISIFGQKGNTAGMNEKDMEKYLLDRGWIKIVDGVNIQVWHPQLSRYISLSIHDAYRGQLQFERNQDCGCS